MSGSIPPEYLNQIVAGDARELAKRIPDKSVDLILTDPPYPLEYLPLYEFLADMASRILKPSGYLFSLVGHEYLPEITQLMGKHLKWWWINSNMQPSNATAKHWQKNIGIWWKPVVVYRRFDWVDTKWFTDAHMAERDKRFHSWGQSESSFSWYIQWMTDFNSLVVDPYCGGGTVPAVCKMLGRNYIAFEIDPSTAERARERVRNTQPPLFVLQPEQEEMDLT